MIMRGVLERSAGISLRKKHGAKGSQSCDLSSEYKIEIKGVFPVCLRIASKVPKGVFDCASISHMCLKFEPSHFLFHPWVIPVSTFYG
mgnify:FL=1